MKFPELSTDRLKLIRLCHDDVEDIFTLFTDDKVLKYYDLSALRQHSQARSIIDFFNARFDANTGIRWGIRLKDSNKLIGTCGFNSWNLKMKSAEVGYDLLPSFWRYGYASEAVSEILTAAFSGQLPCGELNRIQADTVPGNDASETLLLKLGFKEEGLRRESGYWKGVYHDLKCFGLIESEYAEMAL
jgi:RimJ/RimL family protein N-acetyltransferase